MDAPETDVDVQLQRTSASLLEDFQTSILPFLWKTTSSGKPKIRRRVRARETDRLVALLEPFQELPQLLDPHLDKLVPVIADAFLAYLRAPPQKHRTPHTKLLAPLSNAICRLLYTFCKIRGEKVIVRFFSTETRHLELVLSALEQGGDGRHADAGDAWDWEERYIALLWLSQLLLAPFDLSTISSEDTSDIAPSRVPGLVWPADVPGVTLRVIPLAIGYLSASGKEKDAAKVLLVRIAMRKDMQELGILSALVQWALSRLRSVSSGDHSAHDYIGILSFLAGLLVASLGTADMDGYIPTIFNIVQSIPASDEPIFGAIFASAVARKIIVKILRTLTVLLIPKPESAENIDMIQSTIGFMLESLSDSATPVRLAASKALSMIALKLDPEEASQVVLAVLDILEENVLGEDISRVNPLAWHGTIMTISHLLYRRSIPAGDSSLILKVLSALLLGLSFEQRSTTGASIGTNVRDAACFGIWALARRYSTLELQDLKIKGLGKSSRESTPVLQMLANHLVASASLDSAGNIRRGSSAALQELIGRHPDIIVEGIQLVQVVDYHAVALRARAVQEVALQAALLSPHYYFVLRKGLLGWRGVRDADATARRNAASALGRLVWARNLQGTNIDPWAYFRAAESVVINARRSLATREVEARHGLTLALGSLIRNFGQYCTITNIQKEFASMPPLTKGLDPDLHPPDMTTFYAVLEEIISQVLEALSEVKTVTTWRHPELIAESSSILLSSLYPILKTHAIFQSFFSQSTSPQIESNLEDFPLYPLLNPQSSFASGIDSQELSQVLQCTEMFHDRGFMARGDECIDLGCGLIDRFLKLEDEACVQAVSDAAADLLLILGDEKKKALRNEWVGKVAVASRGTGGLGYIYTLFKLFPRPGIKEKEKYIGFDWEEKIVQTLATRFSSSQNIETRASILRCLTSSSALHTHTISFFPIIEAGLDDYTTNARGDVGSLVRIEAVKAAGGIWGAVESLDERQVLALGKLWGGVLRGAAEKLDRVRVGGKEAVRAALRDGSVFKTLEPNSKEYFSFLLNITRKDLKPPTTIPTSPSSLNPASNSNSDPDSKQELEQTWHLNLLAGLITSADTGSEDLVRAARGALVDFCESGVVVRDGKNGERIVGGLICLLERDMGLDRVVVPVLEVLGFLLGVGVLDGVGVDWPKLYYLVQSAHFKSGNVKKIEAAVKVYGGMVGVAHTNERRKGGKVEGFDGPYPKAIQKLYGMLLHQYPRVKQLVVDELAVRLGEGGLKGLKGRDWTKAKRGDVDELKVGMGVVA